MWASRRSSLLRADTSSWSLGESLWERSRQFLLLLGRALCLAVVLQGGLSRTAPLPLQEGDFVALEPDLRSSSQRPRHPRLKVVATLRPACRSWAL